MPTTKTLAEYSAEEQLELSYNELCRLRRDHWAAHVAKMPVPAELQAWSAAMTEKHGAGVKVHGHHVNEHVVNWLTALMIVRYGEATHVVQLVADPENPEAQIADPNGAVVPFWPTSFSADDVRRAAKWLSDKDVPPTITYLAALPAHVQKAHGYVSKKGA